MSRPSVERIENMTLYEITGDYLRLLEILEGEEDIDTQTLMDTMEGIRGEFEEKADGYARVMKELEAEAEKYDTEIRRMTIKRDYLNRRSKIIKQRLYDSMKATGNTKFKTELFSFRIQKNGGLQPVDIIQGKEIPDEYCRKEPDNTKIRDALNAGKKLSFATLKERGDHLVIK